MPYFILLKIHLAENKIETGINISDVVFTTHDRKLFFLHQVAKHTSKDDKWLVIENEVYDITRWANRHPGGSKVISHYAGQDGTVSTCRSKDKRRSILQQVPLNFGNGVIHLKSTPP